LSVGRSTGWPEGSAWRATKQVPGHDDKPSNSRSEKTLAKQQRLEGMFGPFSHISRIIACNWLPVTLILRGEQGNSAQGHVTILHSVSVDVSANRRTRAAGQRRRPCPTFFCHNPSLLRGLGGWRRVLPVEVGAFHHFPARALKDQTCAGRIWQEKNPAHWLLMRLFFAGSTGLR